ncbi:aminopeptidase P family protein [Leucobacter zeae]|nr:aminopeptidase P family protein [Leucobacter zeae]
MQTVDRHLVSEAEYAARVTAVRQEIALRGLDAALIWGRGGGSVDRCADIRYLTGFYPVFPTIRDLPGVWSDRGLAAVLVTSEDVVLFSDEPEALGAASGVTESIARSGVGTSTLVDDVVTRIAEIEGRPRVAIASADAMNGHQARVLLAGEAAGTLEIEWCETLVELIRRRKSPAEIALMRRAAEIAQEALEAGFSRVVPGVRESEAVAAMAEVVARNEAVLANAFVYTTSREGDAEDNRLPIHSSREFREGDLFTVDLSGVYAGYFFDLARSTVVGAAPTASQQRAYDLAKGVVDAVVEGLRPGAELGAAARIGSRMLRDAGIDPDAAEFAARGHGLGLAFEGPWVRDDSADILEPGMVISIEQFSFVDGTGATYERNILITEDGPEDLVAVRDFWGRWAEADGS